MHHTSIHKYETQKSLANQKADINNSFDNTKVFRNYFPKSIALSFAIYFFALLFVFMSKKILHISQKAVEASNPKYIQNTFSIRVKSPGWYQCIVIQGTTLLGNAVAKLGASSNRRMKRELKKEPKKENSRLPIGPNSKSANGERVKPYFIYVSPGQRLSPGNSAKLKCMGSGNPLPNLTWIFNGQLLVNTVYSR